MWLREAPSDFAALDWVHCTKMKLSLKYTFQWFNCSSMPAPSACKQNFPNLLAVTLIPTGLWKPPARIMRQMPHRFTKYSVKRFLYFLNQRFSARNKHVHPSQCATVSVSHNYASRVLIHRPSVFIPCAYQVIYRSPLPSFSAINIISKIYVSSFS